MKRKLTTLLLALLAMVPALADDLSLGYCDGQQVDEYAFNNTLSAPLRVLSEIVRRKVLVEEFTGQQCSNCPAGRTNIEECMKDEDHYVMIAHHTGYGTVSLSTDAPPYATYTTTLDASWKPENMEIVAFVANYDETNCTNCTVYNAEGCALEGNDMVDGISTPEVASSATIQAVYDLQGARLGAMRRGLNIVKFNNGSVRKIIIK